MNIRALKNKVFPASQPAGSYLRNDTYMICCPARSGSSMLVHLLRSHPGILSHGEVLGKTVTGFSGPFGDQARANGELKRYFSALKDEDPGYFLYKYVLHSHGHQAVGFKLKYDELATRSYRRIFAMVRRDRDLKIIFLDRENLLERYVSHRIADVTGVTLVNAKGKRPEIPVLTVAPRELELSFRQELVRRSRFRDAFAGHRIIETTYERLVADPVPEMNRIYTFIGVPAHAATTTTTKIVDSDLNKVVANLAELKAHFKGGPYAGYFPG